MLRSLHVKNLALIRETEVEFGEGLNILTGETGAGKSLLIGSVNLALGGKFEKDMLRRGRILFTAARNLLSMEFFHISSSAVNTTVKLLTAFPPCWKLIMQPRVC